MGKIAAMTHSFEPALIIAGLALCLFGWTIYWAGLRLVGAACGALAASALTAIVLIFAGADRWLTAGCAAAAVIGAIAGIFLITRAHYFLFFITGAVAGLSAAWLLEGTFSHWLERTPARVLYFVAFTAIGGSLVLLAHRFLVIALCAFAGALLFALGVPVEYGKWIVLPLFLGSLLLQTGILAALGEKRKDQQRQAGQG